LRIRRGGLREKNNVCFAKIILIIRLNFLWSRAILIKKYMRAIGKTPLIKLERLSESGCAEIFVKYEGGNPTGSMKDRMALSMIEGAEKRGELKPGGTVVEYTGGSTGSSLAMVCAYKGYDAHFVSSDAFAEEKLRTMRAFG